MDSLKGILISIAIFFLLVIPSILDVVSMSVAASQLNKVGAEMIQVIGSSSEYDDRTERAVELAQDRYGIKVEITSGTGYSLGDSVDLKLTKNITQFFNCEEDTGREGCNADFTTNERVMITKRSGS